MTGAREGAARRTDPRPTAAPGVVRRRVLRGPKGWVGRCAWSPDGQRIAVPSLDGAVRVWDVDARGVERVLGVEGAVYAAAFSPTGRLVAAGGEAGRIHVWSVASGRSRHCLPARAAVFGLSISPDRATLAAACADGVVRVWSAQDWGSRRNLEGDSLVTDLAFSPAERMLACAHEGGPVVVWEPDRRRRHAVWDRPPAPAYGLAWSPDGRLVAGGSGGGAVAIWDVRANRLARFLEGAAAAIGALSFSSDGAMLAASSIDGTVRVWSTRSWAPIVEIPGEQRPTWLPGLAFHPAEPMLAIPARDSRVVEVHSIAPPEAPQEAERAAVRYATAKIVLLGDAHAGKTSLGHRLATGVFREHPSTHGQAVWALDALRATREDGTEQEALLWDLAGQHDYRLLHTLHLGDADVVLLAFDASSQDDPLGGARYWLRAIERAGSRRPPIILVGAQVDQAGGGLSRAEIDAFCADSKITGGYVATSALTGEGLPALVARLRELLGRADPVTNTTTETFRRVKDVLLRLKAGGAFPRSLLKIGELQGLLAAQGPDLRLPRPALSAALGNLIKHGHLGEVTLGGSARRILVRPELLYNTAASIVVLAKRAVRGAGSVDEAALFAPGAALPELPPLPAEERASLVDAAVRALLDRAVCTRDSSDGSTLLVFPELVYRSRPPVPRERPGAQVAYVVEGAVENLFAILAVRVGYADFVVRSDHFRDEVEYSIGGGGSVVMRAERLGERAVRLTLEGRGGAVGAVFDRLARLVERLLLARDLVAERFRAAWCPTCGEPVPPAGVERLIREGLTEAACPFCVGPVPLPLDTGIDGREWEGTSVQEDKASADRRQHFQRLVSSLRERVALRRLAAPRCRLHGDTSSDWVQRWMQDVASAGVHVEVATERPGDDAGQLPAPEGALWLRVVAAPDAASAPPYVILPPGTPDPPGPWPHRKARLRDLRDPDRHFALLLELLCDLYGLGWRDRFHVRFPQSAQGAPGGADRPSSRGARPPPRSVVYVHAPEDDGAGEALRRHSAGLLRGGEITLWGPAAILPGEDERKALSDRLAAAHVVVVLLSSHMLSWPAYDLIVEHLHQGRAAFIPVILAKVAIEFTPFHPLKRIPADGTSIATSKDPDGAWTALVRAIRARLAALDAGGTLAR